MGMTRKFLSTMTLGWIDFRSDKERIARSTRKTAKEARKQRKYIQKHGYGSGM
jgi:hypothetical protein